jgi:hypothetical protein
MRTGILPYHGTRGKKKRVLKEYRVELSFDKRKE